MCMYDVINKKAKMRRQKHKNLFESVVLIVKCAKRACGTGVYAAYVRTRLMQSDKSMLLESGSADDEADDYCYGVQILEFEPFRTQIQNTN